MGIIGKLIKRRGDEDTDDMDLEDLTAELEGASGEESGSSRRLMGWIRNRLNKGDADDEEPRDDDDERPERNGGGADVQTVRLDGAPDVRPVGDAGGTATGSGAQPGVSTGPSGTGQSVPVAGGPASPAGGASGAASGVGSGVDSDAEGGDEDDQDGAAGSGDTAGGSLGLDLKDIFQEAIVVDEALKVLAESMDDVEVVELADDLREFFEELESRMGTNRPDL